MERGLKNTALLETDTLVTVALGISAHISNNHYEASMSLFI